MHYDKRFLTHRSDEGGSIGWSIEKHEWDTGYSSGITITDCYNKVNLDFTFHNNQQLDKRLDKLNNLIDSLELFRDKLESCREKPKKFYY